MSTTDPTGEGGGGGGEGEGATRNVEQNASPSTPITGVPVQAAAQQQQQPQQHPPPSPLSGCYLLVVLPEPHTAQHKDLILNRLAKGETSLVSCDCKSRFAIIRTLLAMTVHSFDRKRYNMSHTCGDIQWKGPLSVHKRRRVLCAILIIAVRVISPNGTH